MKSITVRLHGGLAHDPAPCVVELPRAATLLDIQDHLGVPRGEVGLFVVDGELRHEGDVPLAGALVDLYPMFGGG